MSESEPNTSTNPLEQLLALLGTLDPIDLAGKAVDVTRRTSESLLTVLENFASTVDNLNKTTSRINSLLDEDEATGTAHYVGRKCGRLIWVST